MQCFPVWISGLIYCSSKKCPHPLPISPSLPSPMFHPYDPFRVNNLLKHECVEKQDTQMSSLHCSAKPLKMDFLPWIYFFQLRICKWKDLQKWVLALWQTLIFLFLCLLVLKWSFWSCFLWVTVLHFCIAKITLASSAAFRPNIWTTLKSTLPIQSLLSLLTRLHDICWLVLIVTSPHRIMHKITQTIHPEDKTFRTHIPFFIYLPIYITDALR